MSKINITSGKILQDNSIVECEYTQERENARPAVLGGKYTDPPKQSLIDAFAKLTIHAALVCELIEANEVPEDIDDKDLADFHVSGFSLSESKRNGQGVVITAQKTLSTGKVFGFNTHVIHFNDTSDTAYEHTSELWRNIETVKEELVKYINGDHGPDPQAKIDFPENSDESVHSKAIPA